MKIYVDIDHTIFKTNGMEYDKSNPIKENINKVNQLYNEGHTIILWTARGTLSNNCFFNITYEQLKQFNVKFHELRMGKPAFDILIDDKTINSIWDWDNVSVNSIFNKKKTNDMIIIIQARTGSTRLPQKVLLPFYKNKTILDIICDRLSKNKYQIPVCVATTNNSKDDILFNKYDANLDVLCYRGDEDNVLKRYINCANHFNKKNIIRVCSDNPLISLKYMEKLIDSYLENNDDYSSYTIDGSKCCMKSHIGIFTEIVSLNALENVAKQTTKKNFLENVTEYIYETPEKFSVNLLKEDFNSSIINDIRLTLDTQEDMDILKNIYDQLNIEDDINFYEILNYLHENKHILDIMRKTINNNIK
jgi:spore coat polysaccharide biosynthesis protein SpsF